MSTEEHTNWELIAKHLSGECNPEEEETLKSWIDSTPDNKATFEETKKIWEQSNSTQQNFNPDVDKAWAKVSSKVDSPHLQISHKKPKDNFIYYIKRIAAILIFGAGLSLAYYHIKEAYIPTYVETIIPEGEIKELTLSDGTKVWLNESSKLKYPEEFKRNKREVFLTGEAFFEVAKDADKPFIINSQNSITEVLGTSFNVKSYLDDDDIIVTVVEGKVSFTGKDISDAPLILEKDDKGILNKVTNTLTKQKNDDLNFMAWKTGQLIFKATPIKDVAETLSAYYDVIFDIQDKEINSCRLTATFNFREQALKEVLHIIQVAIDTEFEINKGIVKLKYQNEE